MVPSPDGKLPTPVAPTAGTVRHPERTTKKLLHGGEFTQLPLVSEKRAAVNEKPAECLRKVI